MPKKRQRPKDEASPGVACKKCGCVDMRVIWTRPYGKGIRRLRACRHCGDKTTTVERVVS
jgi:transcriptional regulator NrdR family protein